MKKELSKEEKLKELTKLINENAKLVAIHYELVRKYCDTVNSPPPKKKEYH